MMIRDVWMFADAAADAEMLQRQFWVSSLWVKTAKVTQSHLYLMSAVWVLGLATSSSIM